MWLPPVWPRGWEGPTMSNVWVHNGKGRMRAGLVAASLLLERKAPA